MKKVKLPDHKIRRIISWFRRKGYEVERIVNGRLTYKSI